MDPTLTAPNEGLTDQLDYILSAPITGVAPWYLILWTNDDLVISQATVFADLDEATFSGYGRVTLDRVNWTPSVIADDRAVSTYGLDPVIWTNTGSTYSVYGWAIITPVDSVIRYIQPFPDEVVLDTGDPVGVLPQVALTTLPALMSVSAKKPAKNRAIPNPRR
jgi:hypothetical protein